jgi:copper chaperone CopZ
MNSSDTNNDINDMSTLTFTVPGMTCGHCEAAVKGEVGKVGGVTDVAVDLETKLVTVTGITLSTTDIVAAIDEAGFEVETSH